MTDKKQIIKSTDWLIKGYREEELVRMKDKAIKEAEEEIRNKQIEEMAKDLENHTCMSEFQAGIASRMLYATGYRKQSEGEWIDKPTGAYSRMQSWCSACGKHSGIGGIESNRHKPFCPNCGAKMKGV